MTTVLTRTREIADKEGFDIVVTKDGEPVDPKENGAMGAYPFDRKQKGNNRE